MKQDIWKNKYKDVSDNNISDMHKRLAKELARVNKTGLKEDTIFEYLKDFKYIIPQGSIMDILGTNKIGSLSNCFVVPRPKDSYAGILKTDQHLVQLMKRRGGVGTDLSSLRPALATVNNAAKSSTGAVSFAHRYSNTTREVAQDGRRGALMLTLDIRHPDSPAFINLKKDRTSVTGANISVQLRDDFMKAVQDNKDYILRWPCDTPASKITIIPQDYDKLYTTTLYSKGITIYVKKVKARELFNQIVHNAWDNAEPGIMFLDNHLNYSPDGVYPQYKGMTTNPCGEIFMQPYDACRLLALNLFSFVDKPFTKDAKINYDKLSTVAYDQQILADNIVDLELEHIDRIIAKIKADEDDETNKIELDLWENIKTTCKNSRRTGCGFTGLADMLAAIGVDYNSNEALLVIRKVMHTKMKAELSATIELARRFGAFEGYDYTIENNDFYDRLKSVFPVEFDQMQKYGRRNVSWSTVAPTGTVSIMTETTSGLEPLFQPYYIRRRKINPNETDVRVDFIDQNKDAWMEYSILHPKFQEWYDCDQERWWLDENGNKIPLNECHLHIADSGKTYLEESFEESPWFNNTANDINSNLRIKIQSIIQKYTTHSISSTINLPEDISEDVIYKIYMDAYKYKLKGVTVYRDNCRTGVLVNKIETKTEDIFDYVKAHERKPILPCDIHHLQHDGERYTAIVGLENHKPYELFVIPGTYAKQYSSGYVEKIKSKHYNLITSLDEQLPFKTNFTEGMSDTEEALCRMISGALRHRMDVKFIVEQLSKTQGHLHSFSKLLARILKKYIPEGEISTEKSLEGCTDNTKCNIIFQEGCVTCSSCGLSKC